MPVQFASDAWVAALKEAINTHATYRENAKTWEGDFHFVIEPDDVRAGEAAVSVYLDLWHGECRVSRFAVASDAAPEFVIRGARKNWIKVMRREMDPIKALVTNALKLKGNLAKVMRNVKAAQELVNAVAMVETVY